MSVNIVGNVNKSKKDRKGGKTKSKKKISQQKQIQKFTMNVNGINFPVKDWRALDQIIVKNKNKKINSSYVLFIEVSTET